MYATQGNFTAEGTTGHFFEDIGPTTSVSMPVSEHTRVVVLHGKLNLRTIMAV